MKNAFAFIARSPALIEQILRDRRTHFLQTRHGETLPRTIASLLFVTIAGLATCGFVTGLGGGSVVQALLSALKLPALFVVAGAVCLPSFYQFSILSGSRLRFLQAIALLLTSQAISATLTLGFAPIILLFWLSKARPAFLAALNLASLGLSTLVGLIFFVQGVLYAQETEPPDRVTVLTWIGIFFRRLRSSLVLVAWLGIYGLVGVQLYRTWRPFFGVSLYESAFWTGIDRVLARIFG